MRHDAPISGEKRSPPLEAAEPEEKLAKLRDLLAEMGSALDLEGYRTGSMNEPLGRAGAGGDGGNG